MAGSTAIERDVRPARPQRLPDAGDRGRRADAGHEGVGRAIAELRQDLGSGGRAVDAGVDRILELMGQEGVRIGGGDGGGLLHRARA